jgi:hypothetical protein
VTEAAGVTSLRHVSLRETGWSRKPYEFRALATGIKG